MASEVTLLSTPQYLAPINSYLWFNGYSDWSPVLNFKYTYKVREIDPILDTVQEELGSYNIPASPQGEAYFSPNKILKPKISYSPIFSLSGYRANQDYFVKYNVKYGFKTDLTFPYVNEGYVAGYVAIIFTYPHNLPTGLYIEVETPSTFNPQYNTTALITDASNSLYVITDIPWGTSGPKIGGDVKIPYLDAVTYSTARGTLGFKFAGANIFQAGDIINIDKTDKTINVAYDGVCTVVETTSDTIAVDKEFGVASLVLGDNGGVVSKLDRINGTSSNYYTYNGTRKYDERTIDFSNRFAARSGSITSVGFLHDYSSSLWKEVPSTAAEVQQIFIDPSSALTSYQFRGYNSNMTLVSSASITFSCTYSSVYEFGCGPKDIPVMFGPSALTNVTYYELYLQD